jgi:hypothetical protein
MGCGFGRRSVRYGSDMASFLPFVGWNVERFDPWASNRRSLPQTSDLRSHCDDPFRAFFSLGQVFPAKGFTVWACRASNPAGFPSSC